MADTKKEHYVPRCYLQNFATEEKRIDVFDKWKLAIRTNQDIFNIAMENRFYDVDLIGPLEQLEPDAYEETKRDLMEIVDTKSWEDVLEILKNDKYIEKELFSKLEGPYNAVLASIIKKSYGGSNWVIQNCNAMSEVEKTELSFFVALQVIRTRRFRDTLGDMFEGMVQALAYKTQMKGKDVQPREAFEVKANPEYIKLQHSMMMLDPEATIHLAEILENHIWVMYVNKTEIPFLTSDDPVVAIPHKKDRFMSYSGFGSPGIEVVFPISSTLLLGMYDRTTYAGAFTDRQFLQLTKTEDVEYYNMQQVVNSNRCVFGKGHNFLSVKKFCEDNPRLQEYRSRVQVG